jgi:hypothetical protein
MSKSIFLLIFRRRAALCRESLFSYAMLGQEKGHEKLVQPIAFAEHLVYANPLLRNDIVPLPRFSPTNKETLKNTRGRNDGCGYNPN